jgi:hypothetical protein
MNSNQCGDLLKCISSDHKLRCTEDTSLLSEEQYPMELSPLFDSLTKPTSLQDAINLLKWDRTKASYHGDKSHYELAKTEQNNLRKALQLTPDIDNPWEKLQYQDWKDKITLICLSAVQKVAMVGINHENPLSWTYSPKLVDSPKLVVPAPHPQDGTPAHARCPCYGPRSPRQDESSSTTCSVPSGECPQKAPQTSNAEAEKHEETSEAKVKNPPSPNLLSTTAR